jgi:hypothetical protein
MAESGVGAEVGGRIEAFIPGPPQGKFWEIGRAYVRIDGALTEALPECSLYMDTISPASFIAGSKSGDSDDATGILILPYGHQLIAVWDDAPTGSKGVITIQGLEVDHMDEPTAPAIGLRFQNPLGAVTPSGITITWLNLDSSATVPNGSVVVIDIFPPIGRFWRLLTFHWSCPAPAGAGAGNHTLRLQTIAASNIEIHTVGANFNQNMLFNAFSWQSSIQAVPLPADPVAIAEALHSMRATPDDAMRFRYGNSTNASQVGTRTLRVLLEEVVT